MAANVTLATFRTRCREAAGMELQASSGFVKDAELDRRINQANRELYDKLIVARPSGYYRKSTTATTVAGSAVYPTTGLPADFYKLVTLTLDDASRFVTLDPWEEAELGRLLTLEKSGFSSAIDHVFYRLVQNGVELRPKPQTSGWTLTLYYVPTYTDLVLVGDAFDGINGWEEWSVLTVAIGMLAKEESDTRPLSAERARIEDRIQALAAERDAGRSARIVDTRGDWAGIRSRGRFREPPP